MDRAKVDVASLAGPIRLLDGRVAPVVGFADAGANFVRLNEIPERLREHAERLQAAVRSEFELLEKLDRAAQAADGIPELATKLAG